MSIGLLLASAFAATFLTLHSSKSLHTVILQQSDEKPYQYSASQQQILERVVNALKAENYTQAVSLIRRALKHVEAYDDNPPPTLYSFLGDCYLRVGNLEKALDSYYNALACTEPFLNYFTRCLVAEKAEILEKVRLSGLRSGTQLSQELPSEYLEGVYEKFMSVEKKVNRLTKIAANSLEDGDYAKAAHTYSQLKELIPKSGNYHFLHGHCMWNLRDIETTLVDYKTALQAELPVDTRGVIQEFLSSHRK